MRRTVCALLACLWLGAAFAADVRPGVDARTRTHGGSNVPDSLQIEQDLQHLDWPQFRSVIESVPKLKSDVEAYGPLGWKYVEAHYRTYHWQKNVDKLDDVQKKHLADLIRKARR